MWMLPSIFHLVDSDDDGKFELEKMRSILEESMLETRSMPPENRPRLPRIPVLNPMLVTYLEASWDLCETDSIFFGAALAVCRIIGANFPWLDVLVDKVAPSQP
ncbi:unnamed protein product [Parnassius apollo]|uniref:(apollo) hypothetical protein n=1 Tax=Parnassius apollo TaxID=110799 RepID=A0A8S3XYZ2_PARAO|nr:unnamed protein product [Parnassius apollo]